MKIEILKKEGNLLEFKIIGERHTLPNLLKDRLLNDSSVEFVSYKLDHPMDEDSLFIIKTKGKTPKKALLEASKSLEDDLAEFQKKAKKALSD